MPTDMSILSVREFMVWSEIAITGESNSFPITAQPLVGEIKEAIWTQKNVPKGYQQLREYKDGEVLPDERVCNQGTTNLYLTIDAAQAGAAQALRPKTSARSLIKIATRPAYPPGFDGSVYYGIATGVQSRQLNGNIGPENVGNYYERITAGDGSSQVNGRCHPESGFNVDSFLAGHAGNTAQNTNERDA